VAPPENEGEAWEWDSSLTNRRLSSDYLKVSPVYQKKRPAPHTQRSRFQFATQADRDREERRKSGRHRLRRIDEEEEDEVEGEYDDQEESENEEEQNGGHEEASFAVGSACAARLLLYHGLFHWKRRLMARIKLELKKELRRRRVSPLITALINCLCTTVFRSSMTYTSC